MSPKLFADDYEDDGEEALSRLALRGGGGERPSLLFCFTFSSRPLFPIPYRCLSVWCVRRAVVSRVCCLCCVSSQHQQHVSLFSVALVFVLISLLCVSMPTCVRESLACSRRANILQVKHAHTHTHTHAHTRL